MLKYSHFGHRYFIEVNHTLETILYRSNISIINVIRSCRFDFQRQILSAGRELGYHCAVRGPNKNGDNLSTGTALTIQLALQWRHNGQDGVSNHQPHDCLLNRSFKRRSKKTSKLRATGLCAGNSPGTGEFPAQRASNAENASIWWRHHEAGFPSQYHQSHVRQELSACLYCRHCIKGISKKELVIRIEFSCHDVHSLFHIHFHIHFLSDDIYRIYIYKVAEEI